MISLIKNMYTQIRVEEGRNVGRYLLYSSGGRAGLGVCNEGISLGLPVGVAINLDAAQMAIGSKKGVFIFVFSHFNYLFNSYI